MSRNLNKLRNKSINRNSKNRGKSSSKCKNFKKELTERKVSNMKTWKIYNNKKERILFGKKLEESKNKLKIKRMKSKCLKRWKQNNNRSKNTLTKYKTKREDIMISKGKISRKNKIRSRKKCKKQNINRKRREEFYKLKNKFIERKWKGKWWKKLLKKEIGNKKKCKSIKIWNRDNKKNSKKREEKQNTLCWDRSKKTNKFR